MENHSYAGRLLTGITAIFTWFALVVQFVIMINTSTDNHLTKLEAAGRFFAYFTILTNLLVAVNLTSVFLSPSSVPGRFFSRSSPAAATAVYILIVGIIYNILLRPLWKPEGWQKIADESLHVIVPLLYVLYWYFFASKKNLQWKNIVGWLIYPFFYLVYMLIRGAWEGFYPYPFLDVNVLGYSKAFLNAGSMLFVFLITGGIFILIGRKKAS